jgi:hypothetical protein
MSAGQFPKRRPSYQVYGQVLDRIRPRIERPIRCQVLRQVEDGLWDQVYGWHQAREHIVNLIWAAIDSPQEGGRE